MEFSREHHFQNNAAAQPLPPGFARTPPRIIQLRTARARNGIGRIVLTLDQRILARPALARSVYAVEGLGPAGAYDQPVRIIGDAYNPRTRSITLTLARRPRPFGSVQLRVSASGIVNLLGQTLAGDGVAGHDFLGTFTMP